MTSTMCELRSLGVPHGGPYNTYRLNALTILSIKQTRSHITTSLETANNNDNNPNNNLLIFI